MLLEQAEETKYFFELTPDRILNAVERFGVRCTGRITQLNSMENRVYEVEIELEPGYVASSPRDSFRVVKFYRPGRWSREQILEEHSFLFDLAAADVPAVAPIKDSNGQSLLSLEGIEIYVALFPKRGGRAPYELSPQDAEKFGRLIASVHCVGAAQSAQHRVHLSPSTYARENLEFLRSTQIIPPQLEPRYAQLVMDICTLSEPLFNDIKVQRIHGDCHLGNVLWGSEGVFLVDFDDMVIGPPVQDFWLLLPGRGEEVKNLLDALLDGYEQLRHFDRKSLVLIEPLRALRYIHFSAWIARRRADPAFQRAFPYFGTETYWVEQCADLLQQVEIIQAEQAT